MLTSEQQWPCVRGKKKVRNLEPRAVFWFGSRLFFFGQPSQVFCVVGVETFFGFGKKPRWKQRREKVQTNHDASFRNETFTAHTTVPWRITGRLAYNTFSGLSPYEVLHTRMMSYVNFMAVLKYECFFRNVKLAQLQFLTFHKFLGYKMGNSITTRPYMANNNQPYQIRRKFRNVIG